MLLYASIRYICFSHALKANVSQEEQQQQQEEDRGSLVNRLYLRKPVKKSPWFSECIAVNYSQAPPTIYMTPVHVYFTLFQEKPLS